MGCNFLVYYDFGLWLGLRFITNLSKNFSQVYKAFFFFLGRLEAATIIQILFYKLRIQSCIYFIDQGKP